MECSNIFYSCYFPRLPVGSQREHFSDIHHRNLAGLQEIKFTEVWGSCWSFKLTDLSHRSPQFRLSCPSIDSCRGLCFLLPLWKAMILCIYLFASPPSREAVCYVTSLLYLRRVDFSPCSAFYLLLGQTL